MTTQEKQDFNLAKILGDPDNVDLFKMDNRETYKGYDIYEQDGTTLATVWIGGGVQCYSLQSVGNLTRQALKAKIDSVTN